MEDLITIRIEKPYLKNNAHRVFVTIDLQKAWEEIKLQPNIMVTVDAYLPVIHEKEVKISLYQEYELASLLEEKQVQMEFEITEAIDESKAASASASVLSYSKQ